MNLLRECLTEIENGKGPDDYTQDRLRAPNEFFTHSSAWYERVRTWAMAAIVKFVKMGQNARKLFKG